MVFQWLVYFQKSYLKREWERVNLNKPFRERGRERQTERDRERQREQREQRQRAETESWDRERAETESWDRDRERELQKRVALIFFFSLIM